MEGLVATKSKLFTIEIPQKGDDEGVLVKRTSQFGLPQIALLKIENEASFVDEEVVGFRKVRALEKNDSELLLKLQYIEGLTLAEYSLHAQQLEEKLQLCVNIAKRLARVHNQQVVHLNLNPRHVLIEQTTNEIYFISLGSATHAERKMVIHNKLLYSEADPDYISPEQTGRISTDISYSSDIYSLGVIFYELFTDRLPFGSKTGAAKIHAHIALSPEVPHLISQMPEVLSDLIMKMLEKDVNVRYNSVNGVLHDLEKMLSEYQEKGKVKRFKLGENDSSGLIRFTNNLFGREKQIEMMTDVFSKVREGGKDILLVYGHSGTGKSALVDRLYRPVIQDGGFFISGKFDSLKTDVPYFAFSQAFAKLMEIVRVSREANVLQWKAELHSSLHPIGRVLYEVVPGLEELLPNEPELPEINGLEAQARFNYAITSFVRVVSELCKPLVVFLDDLQWTDSLSISLLKNILTNDEIKDILIIGAYRDNEVTVGHVFLQFKMEIQDLGIIPNEISVENLTYDDVLHFVEDSLGHSDKPLNDLASLVHKKTGGNALFVNQFVKSIYNNEMLYFESDTRTWKWDEEKVLRFNIEGDIVNLLLVTVNKLKIDTIAVLKLASCIGNKFHLSTLVQITGNEQDTVYKNLKPAINIGLIIETREGTMYFVHDRVQQAIYSLTDDAEKGKFHLEIGRLILENTPEEHLRDSIFDIVNQFNFAKELIVETDERKKCCELNFMAGNRSQNATAYFVALQYYENALEFLEPDAWHGRYSYASNLYWQAAVAANQCNRPERFNELIEVLDRNATETHDIIKIANIKLQHVIAENDYKKVLEIGLEILNRIGIKIKAKPSQIDVLIGYIRTNMRLGKFSDEQIAALPKIEDEQLITTMAILHHVSLAAYFIEPNMVPLIMFKLIQLTLEKGLGPKSPFAFVVFGYINIAYMNKMEKGIKMGELGYKLSKIVNVENQIASLKQVYNTFISHWMMHLGDAIPDLENGFKKGLETGDFEFTSITGQLIIYWKFYAGEPLERVLRRGELLSLQIGPLNQVMQIERIKLFRQSVLCFIEGVEDYNILKGPIYDETKVNFTKEPAFDLYYHNVNAQKKLLAMTFNEDEIAWKFCCQEKAFMIPVKGSPTEILFYFYENLSITPIYHTRSRSEQKKLLKICRKNIKFINGLLKFSSVNYKHRHDLMLAEYLQLTGENDEASKIYSSAIRFAQENKFMHDEALAWERAGHFYKSIKRMEVVSFYYTNAYKTYSRWGALAKLEQMKQRYRSYLSLEEIGLKTNNLDLTTVLKTINLISGELNLENLLKSLMNLVAENSGAEKAYLVVKENNEFLIKSSVDKSQNDIQVLQNLVYDEFEGISHSVVNYTLRNAETLVLEDASIEIPYANDPYILQHKIKSIGSVPLIVADEIIACLYIENRLVPGAFTKERVEILQVMATQTAISLQNAMLFEQTSKLNEDLTQEIETRKGVEDNLRINEKRLEEYNLNLENKVEERTKDLQAEKAKSDDLLLNILPYDIAVELKEKGKAEAKTFESVTVMFTDVMGFSKIAEKLSATELVAEIDNCFREFDHIVQKYKIEKIKTIGDSYMAVGGLPVENDTHPVDVVMAAFEINRFIDELSRKQKAEGKPEFKMRIGIHTGNVVAGIVGIKKFQYDIWGDTVNVASRMESHGHIGKVNISQSTYELIKDRPDLEFEYRGKIEAKGKGEMDMYFVRQRNLASFAS
jgi:predicted ATPase/class 3 adenylate cyclase